MSTVQGRPLDGHINRCLEGKTIERVEKNGRFLTICCVGGERFQIAWATPNGVGVDGEPCLVKVDVQVVLPQASMVGVARM